MIVDSISKLGQQKGLLLCSRFIVGAKIRISTGCFHLSLPLHVDFATYISRSAFFNRELEMSVHEMARAALHTRLAVSIYSKLATNSSAETKREPSTRK